MGKKVSIMMPAYNAMPLIKASIESILNQTYTNWECIIVDDGSTDGTSDYLDTLPQLDSRFIIHHFEKNMGRPYARQKTLELSTGEYVTMLDAEDLMAPNRLELQVAVLEKTPDLSLVSSAICSFGTKTDLRMVRGTMTFKIKSFNGENCPAHASSMLLGEIARKLQYNPLLKLGQDHDFLDRYLVGRKFAVMPEILYYYSEFDSVTKNKIRRTYLLTAKKFFYEENYLSSIKLWLKYIYSICFFPFKTIESILLKRGRPLSEEQEKCFQQECRSIVNTILEPKSV